MGGLSWHDVLYATSLVVGVLLVIGSALGLSELGTGDVPELAAEVELDAGAGDGLLALLGVGKVPTAVLLLLLSLTFGGSGLALGPLCSALLGAAAGPHVGLLLAGLTALAGTAVGARLFARVLPQTESYASHARDLLGASGRVVVCSRDGEALVAVLDAGGAELRVRARLPRGAVPAGSAILIARYDAARGVYEAEEIS